AKGTLLHIDARAAQKSPGVLAVLTPDHPPRYAASPARKEEISEHALQALTTHRVLYQNQPVAVVVADSLERATHAAALLRVEYRAEPPEVELEQGLAHAYKPEKVLFKETDAELGKPSTAVPAASIDETYTTPYQV